MEKTHIAGYSGYVPGAKFKGIAQRPPEYPTADIPGYSGYVFAYGPENVYGKTFTQISKEIKCTNKYRDRENFIDKQISISKESYINPKDQEKDTTTIPIKNKFIRRTNFDVEKGNVLAVECRERIMKSLGNAGNHTIAQMLSRKIKEEKEKTLKKPLKIYPPIIGYAAANRQVDVGNLHAQDWQSCRVLAKKRVEKNNAGDNKDECNKFGASIFSDKTIKQNGYNSQQPITGYTGFVKRMQADNIFGITYNIALDKAKQSSDKLSYWKKLEETDVSRSLPTIKNRLTKEAWK